MARPSRIEKVGDRYHVTARGNERKAIFRDDAGRRHFPEIMAEMVRRFRLLLHCFVLMDNWEAIQDQVVLGGAEFFAGLRKQIRGEAQEQGGTAAVD